MSLNMECLLCYSNTLLIFVAIVLCFLYKKFNEKNKRFYELLSKIPGPSIKYPLIGNLDIILLNEASNPVNRMDDSFRRLSEEYSDQGLFKLKLGPRHAVCIFRNDYVEDLLKSNSNLEKGFEYKFLYEWLGKGLVTNDKPSHWKIRRRLLTPTFHFKIIEEFLPIMNEKSNILVDKLGKLCDKPSFDLRPLVTSCALDTICETSLGIPINSQKGENREYIEAIHGMNIYVMDRIIKPWLWSDLIYKLTPIGRKYRKHLEILHKMTRNVIKERKQQILENNENISEMSDKKGKRLAFLELLLDLHLKDNSLSLEDIREEVDTFMFAGHDTTAAGLSWTFYFIGLYPEVQYKIQEELDSIVTKDEDITIDHIRRMSYLDAVIKESMRLQTPVPRIMRTITEEIKLGDYTIPKGVTAYVLISRLHYDPNVFPDPFEFRPERFLKENQSQSESAFSFTPFSAGARNCIGQRFAMNELRVVLAKVLLNFEIKSLEERSEVKDFSAMISTPENGVHVTISPRS